jgi:hypothetical protein
LQVAAAVAAIVFAEVVSGANDFSGLRLLRALEAVAFGLRVAIPLLLAELRAASFAQLFRAVPLCPAPAFVLVGRTFFRIAVKAIASPAESSM